MNSIYKKRLRAFEATGLKLWEVVVADEVECYLNNHYDEFYLEDEDFDKVCEFVYDWIMNSEAQANEVVRAFFNALRDGNFELSDLYNDYDKVVSAVNSAICCF